MSKDPIGLIIRQIIREKNLSASKIAEKLGVHRQTIYNTYTRVTMDEVEIDNWAKVLGMSKEELEMRWAGESALFERTKREEAPARHFGEEVAARIEAEVVQIRELFEKELDAKNRQIESLIELLGKLEVGQQATGGRIVEFRPEASEPLKMAI